MASNSNSNCHASADSTFSNVVLGLPIPRAVQQLPRVPPACHATEGDRTAIELLRALGTRQRRPENEIARACELAHGISDVVVILERPRAKTYDVSFDKFVEASDTLRSLDALIRFSTRGALSIHTVSVLDAFSFQENKHRTDSDLDCHRTLADIIRAKKPKIIIRCHRDEYLDEWMRRFELPGEEYRLARQDVEIEDGHLATVFQSFHMSCAVQNASYRPEFRALLIHHFVAAFGELHGHGQLPEYVEELRVLCNKKGNRIEKPFRTEHMAARYTSQALSERYDESYRSHPIEFADLDGLEQTESRALAFHRMYKWLTLLARGKCNPGSLALGRIKLFNWAEFFSLSPLSKQVVWLLNTRGTDQSSWITPESYPTHNETKLSLARLLKELKSQKGTSNQGDLVQIRRQLVARIKERTLVAEQCLRDTSIAGLAESLDFASTLAFYKEFIVRFDKDGYILGVGQDGVRMDVLFCQRYLKELDKFLTSGPEDVSVQTTENGISLKNRFVIRSRVYTVDVER